MEPRIFTLLARVLKVPESSISLSASPESVEAWDSLMHMRIVVALEEEFQVAIDEDEIAEMTSVAEIVRIIGVHTDAQ